MGHGGKRTGAGGKPACVCGTCKLCKHRLAVRAYYYRNYVSIGRKLEDDEFKRLPNGDIVYAGKQKQS